MSQRRQRLDMLLVERALAHSRSAAQAMIMAGEVSVDGRRADKPGQRYPEESEIQVNPTSRRFASRAGEKLEGALEAFGIEVDGAVAIDVGSSTGGFTDCLLRRGAARVYAVDVGHGLLDWRLRQDERVVVIHHPNQGLTRSLNVGLRRARGEFVARQDADDVSLPSRLGAQVGKAIKQRLIRVAFGPVDLPVLILREVFANQNPLTFVVAVGIAGPVKIAVRRCPLSGDRIGAVFRNDAVGVDALKQPFAHRRRFGDGETGRHPPQLRGGRT